MDWRQKLNITIAVLLLANVGILILALWKNRFDPVVTDMVLKNETAGISFPLSVLGLFSIVYLTASYFIFEYVVEE